MLIVAYVCAEFRDGKGRVIHRIPAGTRGQLQEVPDEIRQDLLFEMLVKDGSIRVPENEAQKKVLEQNPMVGVSPDGKSDVMKEAKAAKSEKGSKPAKAAGNEPAVTEKK